MSHDVPLEIYKFSDRSGCALSFNQTMLVTLDCAIF